MNRAAIYLPVIIGFTAIYPLLYAAMTGGFNAIPTIPSGRELTFEEGVTLYLIFVFSQFIFTFIDARLHPWNEYTTRKTSLLLMLFVCISMPLLCISVFYGIKNLGMGIFMIASFFASMSAWFVILALAFVGKQPKCIDGRFVPLLYCLATSYYNIFVMAHFD